MLVLWGVAQWLALVALNNWLAPQRDLSHTANAAYAGSLGGFAHGMLTASTSLWYLYALIVYFVVCKIFSRLQRGDGFSPIRHVAGADIQRVLANDTKMVLPMAGRKTTTHKGR